MIRICSIDGCGKPAEKRGWCGMHYRRFQRHGSPNFTKKPGNGTLLRWIEDNATYAGNECLDWPVTANGSAGRPIPVSYMGKRIGGCRLMCILANGPPPTDKHQAAHSCGNGHKGCINPRHLSWKTPVENAADMLIHGTSQRGERHGMAKLNRTQVKEIRARYSTGRIAMPILAQYFGVSKSMIDLIVKRQRWGWLD